VVVVVVRCEGGGHEVVITGGAQPGGVEVDTRVMGQGGGGGAGWVWLLEVMAESV
jgi:hypothetical protein